MKRKRFLVTGQVQGVGFRPFVYREATARGLSGHVGNTAQGVEIEVQGSDEALCAFNDALRQNTPALARIVSLSAEDIVPQPLETDFFIRRSPAGGHGHAVLVSPDVATCDDCLKELFDPADRRYLYPFINCTACGPRYTLTKSIPYDRSGTSMACFPLCDACAAEYQDPANRRFHAQPNACPECGPRLWLAYPGRATLPPPPPQKDYVTPVRRACDALFEGRILAMKGLGGFHLVCDARNEAAVALLRLRKKRPHKALAVMTATLDDAKKLAVIRPEEEALLTSRERPITLVERKSEREGGLPEIIAPDVDSVGLLLPYTPLHHVLLHLAREHTENAPCPALVMTSGNAAGAPICLGNREALRDLKDIADLFLLHDRDILVRADDSVVRALSDGTTQFIRRARGYTPVPLPLFPDGVQKKRPQVFAAGADLKNTVCLTRNADAFVSQHTGDLGHPGVEAFHREVSGHLEKLLEISPTAVVCDRHPGYVSTRIAQEEALRRNIPLVPLQHHTAHLFSVLGEHNHTGPALGLILDGTGFGTDGTVWGGEVLFAAQDASVTRLARLSPFPLPGGEAAIREPWRIARGFLARLGLLCPKGAFKEIPQALQNAVAEAVSAGFGIQTSSCGRLFDAVSALLGLCGKITYEGQAAIRLEQAQDTTVRQGFAFAIREAETKEGPLSELDSDLFFRQAADALAAGVRVPVLARKFHLGLAEGLAELTLRAARRVGVFDVALGGGVYLNRSMETLLSQKLRERGLHPLKPLALPPGDGALSYGQAVWFVKKKIHSTENGHAG